MKALIISECSVFDVLPYLSNSLIIDFSFETTESEICCSRVKASVYTL